MYAGTVEDSPHDRALSVRRQIIVGQRKMAASKEACVGRKRRGMRGLKNQVAVGIDEHAFLTRVASPQQKNKVFAFAVQELDQRVGEPFPAAPAVAAGAARRHRQCRVQQQDALVGPALQVAVGRNRCARVALDLAQDVAQAGWDRGLGVDRKRQAMRLPGPW